MFRKILVAMGVGAVVGSAVFASAAGLTNTVPDLGASTTDVAACDTTIATDFATAYESAIGEYEVTDVTVSGLDAACEGADIDVQLVGAADAALGTEVSATVGTSETSKVFSFASQNLKASDMVKVAVVIAGP